MATMAAKAEQNPLLKTQTRLLVSHAALRALGIAAALIAIGLMSTGKQAVELLGSNLSPNIATLQYSGCGGFSADGELSSGLRWGTWVVMVTVTLGGCLFAALSGGFATD
ncbi:hypothetical protein Syun_024580 [Stephania yunnanensis]|uniref:Uncharacterized protein n=1 Tax=Stephania yunnanensis TaxID=152371 RepID=A0AAP0I4N5_9MAGN